MESDVRMVEEGPSAEITDVERIRVGRNRLEQVINSRKSHSPCSAHLFVFGESVKVDFIFAHPPHFSHMSHRTCSQISHVNLDL